VHPVLPWKGRSWTGLNAFQNDEAVPVGRIDPDVIDAARSLLGSVLLSSVEGSLCAGVIVETEAYGGMDDPASHAATRHGPTPRNRVMFGPAGLAYVYQSYGVHWCVNVVTGAEGSAGAVLIRGLDPLFGMEAMSTRRQGRTPLGAGPGRLCQAMGVTGELNGHDLAEEPLRLLTGWAIEDPRIGVSPRIGIRRAAHWPNRFYVRGARGVSRPDGWSPPAV